MDLIAGFSGFFFAASLVWIALGLLGALILGALVAGLFVSIFYGASRAAAFAGRARSRAASGN